ncbi:TIGR02680 family protein [Actinacidiphila acididurans]|uniref:TIGR02680 family protein n=1 Tax=Actinacidiphila acididurans TaxID=2784346 RepID=A0ABS2U055_9ACTN|nr:TIGR02680 family protein [Actinacidiphila acididurans]MBM9508982.1 TIGR02680 family protein [Actinacidiphila acididurans]
MSVTDLPVRSTATSAEHDSPAPRRRWRPYRAGILNVWRYYDETFAFHQGRLLLRGQNGTGKSKALELLLPFLFDASLRPNRLSTFGGSERTMHWNLMGEGATGKTRVGYVWMEFGRPSDDGGSRWFTCGARLQASTHTPSAHADYFTTTQRIAKPGGLLLANEPGQPLTKAALADAMDGHGEIHASADAYRTAVRGALFAGMGEQRYEALITALLQLRQPKLSERLDPSLLSTLLSRALPPLGEGEISELAEGFERLDRQREHLKDLDGEVSAAGTIAARQRSYAQRALRAHAATMISATTEMDNLTRVARESAEEHERALRSQEMAERQRDEYERQARELEAGIEGLMDRDAYKQGKELDKLRRGAERAESNARRQRTAADGKLRLAEDDRQRADIAAERARVATAHAQAASEDARRAGRTAGMQSVHCEAEAMLETPTATTDAPSMADAAGQERVRPARRLLRGAVKARQGQITEVVDAVDRHERTVRERTSAEAALDQARVGLAEAVTRRDEAARGYEEALTRQAELLREWATGCVELRFADVEELASRAAVEVDVMAAVEFAVRTTDQDITGAQTRTEASRAAALTERAELTGVIGVLRREADLPPAAPPTRTTDRSTMVGAPLWRLVAFHDDVPGTVQAGVEAALEASGLLDAWVSPYGGLTLPGHDTLADAAWAVPAPGTSLLDVLRPEAGAAVPADTVQRLLAGIAFGPRLPAVHMAAVGADGSWRLAFATGTWSKPEPAHIGSVARERARLRRIAELTERLTEINDVAAALDAELGELRERRARLEADLVARPRYRDLDTKRRALDRAEEGVGVRDDAVRRAVGVLADREVEVATSLRTLSRLAAEHTLPTARDPLRNLSSAVDVFRDTADAWTDAYLHWATAVERAASESGRAARSLSAARDHAADAEAAEEEAQALAATLEAVESTVGEDFRAIAARITELRQELDRVRGERKAKDTELLQLAGYIGQLKQKTAQDANERDHAVGSRDEAARRFRHLCALGLPEDAGLAVTLTARDGTRATLEAARAVAAKWPDLPYGSRNLGDAVNRLSEAIHNARESVGRRADLDLESDDDVQIFTASLDGVRIGAAGLLKTLTEERDRSRDDITAAERRLFDQTLTGDTRRHLADRIRGANDLVDRMNGHLQRVRTASKVAVQLVWQVHPDLPPGTRTARELLLKDPARITDADREALHAFFRARIEEAKAKNTAASWEEQLAEVLDYTAWHQFVVKLDRANGAGWQLLTKKLHGALSGGEKAIALHLPLFAAVASHYEAVPDAPRPILLDEVFVGVDTTNRGQVFALLSALDLDLVLTSDHEWCTYRELSGIAVHQLITGTDDGDDAVTSARFVWNGVALGPEEPEEPEEPEGRAGPAEAGELSV